MAGPSCAAANAASGRRSNIRPSAWRWWARWPLATGQPRDGRPARLQRRGTARPAVPGDDPPDDLAADLRQVDRLLAGEIDSYRLEKRYRHKDGHYLWALLAVSLVRDEHTGEPRHFIAQVEDIHTRKLAQEQLEAQTRRTQLAVEAGGVGIWEWDFTHGAITWDARMHALHGTPPELGPPTLAQWIAMVHPEDVSRVSAEMRQAIRGARRFDTEYRIVRPAGEIRHVRAMATISRHEDDTARSLVGTNWDITEQRTLTRALFEEKERLHITLRSIGDAVICTDRVMRVTFMNPIAEQLTGWSMDAAMGQPLDQVFRIVDETPTHDPEPGRAMPGNAAPRLPAGRRGAAEPDRRAPRRAGLRRAGAGQRRQRAGRGAGVPGHHHVARDAARTGPLGHARRADRAAQPRLVRKAPARGVRAGAPARTPHRALLHRPGPLQDRQRHRWPRRRATCCCASLAT
jgi:PAS domain-containing protein